MSSGRDEAATGTDGLSVTTTQALDYIERELGPFVGAFLLGIPMPLNQARQEYDLDQSLSDDLNRRIRNGYEVARVLTGAYGHTTAIAWLFGTNPHTDGRAPIEVLGQSTDRQDIETALGSAREFSFAGRSRPTPVIDLLTDEDFEILREEELEGLA